MLPPAELDFVALNREFRTHLSRFDKDPFEFQVYVVQFSNQFLLPHEEHEVGIMCSYQSNEQFDNMRRQFEENQNEAFTLKRT